jgi:hypothetical protein
MAVIEVEKLLEAEGDLDYLGRFTAKEVFKVVSSNRTDTPAVILTAVGLPQPGQTFSSGTTITWFKGSRAKRVSFLADGGTLWHVTVDYGPYDAAEANPPGPPTEWPIRYRWEAVEFERPAVSDVNGDLITNSAGHPPESPWMVEDARQVLVVQRNELVSTYDPLLADTFKNRLNDATWNGAAALTVKAKPITTGDAVFSQAIDDWYFPVLYRFEYKPEGWTAKFVDRGYAELVSGSPPKLRTITDSNGQDLKEPALLNGSGARLTNPSPGNEVYREYDVYFTADFDLLNLDLSTALGR